MGPQGERPESPWVLWQVLGGPSAFTAPGRCLRSSRLNRVAGVIQLKNNLPLWGYFYPGISPLRRASTQTHTQPRAARVARLSENNRYSSWGSANRRHRCRAAPGRDKR